MARTAASAPYSTRAVVLRTRNLGEKDRVMTLLSPERGKFDAAARGARGPKSKLAAASQPFMLLRLLLAHGRSLDIVTQAEIEESHRHISADLFKTAWACYLCELSAGVPEHLPDDDLFDLLCVALGHLDAAATAPAVEATGRWFEAKYLALLGYAPTLGRCVACGEKIVVPAEDVSRKLSFSPALGGSLCANCGPRDPGRLTVNVHALRALHKLARVEAPPAPDVLSLTGATRRDLRDCLRRSIFLHCEFKPRSQAFLDDVTATQNLHPNDV